jgi:hypothetical protein
MKDIPTHKHTYSLHQRSATRNMNLVAVLGSNQWQLHQTREKQPREYCVRREEWRRGQEEGTGRLIIRWRQGERKRAKREAGRCLA